MAAEAVEDIGETGKKHGSQGAGKHGDGHGRGRDGGRGKGDGKRHDKPREKDGKPGKHEHKPDHKHGKPDAEMRTDGADKPKRKRRRTRGGKPADGAASAE